MFTQEAYAVLAGYQNIFPDTFKKIFSHMRQYDWLASYQDFETISYALHRMSFRLSNKFELDQLLLTIKPQLFSFEADFKIFFNELRTYVQIEHGSLR